MNNICRQIIIHGTPAQTVGPGGVREIIYICTRYVFHAAALLCSFVAAKYTRELLKEDE